jgi:hypothetical protein
MSGSPCRWIRRLMRMQRETRIGCQDLAGHDHDLSEHGAGNTA